MLAWLTWCREQGTPRRPSRSGSNAPPRRTPTPRSAAASRSTGLSPAATSTCGRRRGHRKPAPGTAVGDRDVCPDTGPRAAVLRTGPRPARRRDRHRRTRHRLGSARAAPLRPHAPRRSGASLLSSWPNRATANPRTCADTSNPHPQPYGGSPACLDQEPTGADTQSLMYLVTRFLTTPRMRR